MMPSDVSFHSPLSLQHWALVLAAVLATLGVWCASLLRALPASKAAVLIVLRSLALASAAAVLLGPARQVLTPSVLLPPQVHILVDTSASMAVCDASDEHPAPSRWQAISPWLEPAFLAQLRQHASVSVSTFAERTQPWNPAEISQPPAGRETRLLEALSLEAPQAQSSGSSDSAAPADASRAKLVLILSDGNDTHESLATQRLTALQQSGVRMDAVPVGRASSQRDIRLAADADADVLVPGQSTRVHARITQQGYDGASVSLTLSVGGKLLGRRNVLLDRGAAQASFDITALPTRVNEPLTQSYELRVTPLPGEASEDNNKRVVLIQTLPQRIRVALLEGQPYWDTTFLARALREDAGVELTTVHALTPERWLLEQPPRAAGVASEPVITSAELTGDWLRQFDLIILGRQVERFFPGQKAQELVNFVTLDGRALILARGRPFDTTTPEGAQAAAILQPIEPVQWGDALLGRLRLALTDAGRQSPLIRSGISDAVLTELPDMLAASQVESHRSASVMLLRQQPRDSQTPGMAAMSHMHTAGGGRVLAILVDGLWRWAMLPSSFQKHDSVHQQLWSGLVRWMVLGSDFLPGQSASLQVERPTLQPGEPQQVILNLRSPAPAHWQPMLTLRHPDGSTTSLPLTGERQQSRQLTAQLSPRTPGIYELELADRSLPAGPARVSFVVEDRSLELLHQTAEPENLRLLTQATGGRTYSLADRATFLDEVTLLARAAEPVPRLQWAFASPWVLALLVIPLGAEWLLRRQWGQP